MVAKFGEPVLQFYREKVMYSREGLIFLNLPRLDHAFQAFPRRRHRRGRAYRIELGAELLN